MPTKLTTNEFITRSNKQHNNKFDYTLTEYVNAKTKVCIICPEHGEFWQLPNSHMIGKGCKKCSTDIIKGMLSLSLDEFITRSNTIHNKKYDYTKSNYINYSTKVCIICPEHGEFWQTPDNHLTGKGCRKCGISNNAINKLCDVDDIIKRFNIKHGDKYDYSKVDYIGGHTKVCIICPEHGEFWQEPNSHLSGCGCPKCGKMNMIESNTISTDEFIRRSIIQHGYHYEYSNIIYSRSQNDVCIICPEHGEFWQRPNNHIMGAGCPNCVGTTSSHEIGISNYLKTIGVSHSKNNRTIISPLELDITIPSKNIAIEFNGNYWHSELKGKNRNYHLNKTNMCKEKNIQLIHVFEDEWINKQSIVKSRLRHILGKTKYRIPARKCEIHEITSKKSSQFLNKYHIQGQDKSGIRLGMFYRNRMVAVMTFSKRRFDKKDGYELVRYCTVGHFTVIGGAGKLLKYFERNWNPKSIISYADKRWSNGGLYKSLGFDHTHNSTPNYFYMNKSMIRQSRHKYQKHKLHMILDIFDQSLSEWENMKNNGYDRIWDCGNIVFEKLYK